MRGLYGKPYWMTVFGGIANILLAVILVKVGGLGLAGIAIATLVTWGVVTCLYIVGLVCGALAISTRDFVFEALLRPLMAEIPLVAAAVACRWLLPNHGLGC